MLATMQSFAAWARLALEPFNTVSQAPISFKEMECRFADSQWP